MKLYAPAYYQRFHCIADKCEHSCCIGWEIDIDEDTLQAYQAMKDGYGAVIAESVSMEETPHFKLCEGDRCPHLNERGLCKIILNLGEEHLCDICREHPRFYNFTGVAEVGIGLSCPEAARIVLSSPDYAAFDCIGDVDALADDIIFDGRAERGKLYAILRDESLDYATRLAKIGEIYSIEAKADGRRLELLDALEYLDEAHKPMFLRYSSENRPTGKDAYLERFLAYAIYRHCTEAFDEEDFGCRLSFCFFCERLLASLICSQKAETLEEIAALASILSEEIEYSEDNTNTIMEG